MIGTTAPPGVGTPGAAAGGTPTGEPNGLGVICFVTAAGPRAGAITCWTGAKKSWIGAGSKPTVVRIPMDSATSSASTAVIAATVNPDPTNRPRLAGGSSSSTPSMTTVSALASSSSTAL